MNVVGTESQDTNILYFSVVVYGRDFLSFLTPVLLSITKSVCSFLVELLFTRLLFTSDKVEVESPGSEGGGL